MLNDLSSFISVDITYIIWEISRVFKIQQNTLDFRKFNTTKTLLICLLENPSFPNSVSLNLGWKDNIYIHTFIAIKIYLDPVSIKFSWQEHVVIVVHLLPSFKTST